MGIGLSEKGVEMEKTVTYLGIESVTYKFTEGEILLALRERHKIPATYDYTFELYEGYEDEKPRAELTVRYPVSAEEPNG